MKYAREHIKRYWVFTYRRALGISMFTFAIALAVGMLFTSMLSNIFLIGPLAAVLFWAILIAITTLTFVVSFVDAHISSTKFMNENERHTHSKYVGVWLFSLVIGALAFILPAVYLQDYGVEPVMLLFSFGGIFWVLYASVRALFKHSYFEIAYGASVLWVVFVIALFFLGSVNGPLNYSQGIAVLFISMATLIVVCGGVGITMMFKSTKEFVVDFENVMRTIEGRPQVAMSSSKIYKAPRARAVKRRQTKRRSTARKG